MKIWIKLYWDARISSFYLQKITNQCPLVLFNHGDQMIICLIMMCRLEIDAASKSKVINIMNGLPLF